MSELLQADSAFGYLAMRKRARALRLLAAALIGVGSASGAVHKFKVDQPGARNFGVWRLTHDPAVRDEGNYHNIQCWSPNGRYTCYTHWDGSKGPGGKASAEVHVIDLMTAEDRRVDTGMCPRWANSHNWLFYCHWTGDGTPPYETGTQLIRYDADTREKVVITHGMEGPGSLDSTDTWLYGVQRFRGQKPELRTVRVRNAANSKLEVIKGAPNTHGYIHVNPRYPIIMTRCKDLKDKVYGMNRAFFDLDGSDMRIGSVMGQAGHQSWSGDGKYLLIGNRQVCGRPWNKPFPSDLEVLSRGGVGDICPCGRSGRYICGGGLSFVDTRSGDQWPVVYPGSFRIYPMAGDNSTLMDIDPKGSPDGTKVHYHSTLDLDGLATASITKYDTKRPDVVEVDSTDRFPQSGDLVSRWEVIGYQSKTATTFERVTRQKYGTRKGPRLGSRKAKILRPLSAYVLSKKDRARSRPDPSFVRAKLPMDHPLMFQRYTDCYAVVVRLPDRPHLRLKGGQAELVPGESHWETRGYRLLRSDRPLREGLLEPGQTFVLPGEGEYAAIAVEWSGLASPASLPLKVPARTEGCVLRDAPKDFSWTRELWRTDEKMISRAEPWKGPKVTKEIVHLHDGVIAREEWRNGQRVSHVDLSSDGKPIRLLDFEKGKLTRRMYKDPDGLIRSEELYGPDGFKTEYISYRGWWYYRRDDLRGTESAHWWYKKGRPVKLTKKGRTVFDFTDPAERAGRVEVHDSGYIAIQPENAPAYVRRHLSMDTGTVKYAFCLYGWNIGMPGPSGANFYSTDFVRVSVGKQRFFAKGSLTPPEEFEETVRTKLTKTRESAELIATQEGESATVELRLEAAAGEDCLRMSVACPRNASEQPVVVSLVTYPSGYTKRSGHKVITFNSGRKVEAKYREKVQGDRAAQEGESWLYVCDTTCTAGGCGVEWVPAELAKVEMDVSHYCVRPIFTLKPGVNAHFRLWDFGKTSREDGLVRMEKIAAEK